MQSVTADQPVEAWMMKAQELWMEEQVPSWQKALLKRRGSHLLSNVVY